MLVSAIVFITLALVFYTVGVWSEKVQRLLRPWHVAVFWAGFACDTVGTVLMGLLSERSNLLNFHALTGMLAILLMGVHAVWATAVVVRKNETMMHTFHRFSLVVWATWLIPYLSGLFVGIGLSF